MKVNLVNAKVGSTMSHDPHKRPRIWLTLSRPGSPSPFPLSVLFANVPGILDPPDWGSTRFRFARGSTTPSNLSPPRFVPADGPMNGLSSALRRLRAVGRDFEPVGRGCIVNSRLTQITHVTSRDRRRSLISFLLLFALST